MDQVPGSMETTSGSDGREARSLREPLMLFDLAAEIDRLTAESEWGDGDRNSIVLAKDESTGEVEWNRRFKDRMDFYGVEIKLCRYYRAQTKGKVESGVKYVKRNFGPGRVFADLEDFNAQLAAWQLEVADQRIHGTTHQRPIAIGHLAGRGLRLAVAPGEEWVVATDRVDDVRLVRLSDGRAWVVDRGRTITWASEVPSE